MLGELKSPQPVWIMFEETEISTESGRSSFMRLKSPMLCGSCTAVYCCGKMHLTGAPWQDSTCEGRVPAGFRTGALFTVSPVVGVKDVPKKCEGSFYISTSIQACHSCPPQ
ncbi:hypothetical protein PoB_000777000 [Plakobranchus ocellatus]|uniref:Uncharacterized protein n=1 Tax=Plakobranchus ocellatus TaxID=259542 RepID=A0AAV3YFJ7_9GAST|nr:hypothetical protein PoB_000777000 [Plakobranchus ocellatus]